MLAEGGVLVKKGLSKKIVAVLIAFIFVISFVPYNGIDKVEAAENKIYASKLNELDDIEVVGSTVLVMDVDKELGYIDVTGDLTIEGNKKLTTPYFVQSSGNLTIKSGADITVNNSGLTSYGNIIIEKDANVSVNCTSSIRNWAILTHGGNITVSGNLIVTSHESGLTTANDKIEGEYGTITINGGSTNITCEAYALNGNVNITGGEIYAEGEFAIDAVDLNISGGKVTAYGPEFAAIYSDKSTNITGGEITATSGKNEAILGMGGLTIASSAQIITPENGYVNVAGAYYGKGFTIYDSKSNLAHLVKIKGIKVEPEEPEEPEVPEDPKKDEKKDDNNNNNQNNQDKNSQKEQPKYSNEWVDGKWYNADGTQDYDATLTWKSNATGWWVEDDKGWYPVSSWQKIDGIWYYFNSSGYMAANEYVDGYWLNSDGSCSDKYFLTWKSNATGWWVEDKSGWWPSSEWLKIDGCWYYFDASGYMVTNQYIDGYWIGADGVCN